MSINWMRECAVFAGPVILALLLAQVVLCKKKWDVLLDKDFWLFCGAMVWIVYAVPGCMEKSGFGLSGIPGVVSRTAVFAGLGFLFYLFLLLPVAWSEQSDREERLLFVSAFFRGLVIDSMLVEAVFGETMTRTFVLQRGIFGLLAAGYACRYLYVRLNWKDEDPDLKEKRPVCGGQVLMALTASVLGLQGVQGWSFGVFATMLLFFPVLFGVAFEMGESPKSEEKRKRRSLLSYLLHSENIGYLGGWILTTLALAGGVVYDSCVRYSVQRGTVVPWVLTAALLLGLLLLSVTAAGFSRQTQPAFLLFLGLGLAVLWMKAVWMQILPWQEPEGLSRMAILAVLLAAVMCIVRVLMPGEQEKQYRFDVHMTLVLIGAPAICLSFDWPLTRLLSGLPAAARLVLAVLAVLASLFLIWFALFDDVPLEFRWQQEYPVMQLTAPLCVLYLAEGLRSTLTPGYLNGGLFILSFVTAVGTAVMSGKWRQKEPEAQAPKKRLVRRATEEGTAKEGSTTRYRRVVKGSPEKVNPQDDLFVNPAKEAEEEDWLADLSEDWLDDLPVKPAEEKPNGRALLRLLQLQAERQKELLGGYRDSLLMNRAVRQEMENVVFEEPPQNIFDSLDAYLEFLEVMIQRNEKDTDTGPVAIAAAVRSAMQRVPFDLGFPALNQALQSSWTQTPQELAKELEGGAAWGSSLERIQNRLREESVDQDGWEQELTGRIWELCHEMKQYVEAQTDPARLTQMIQNFYALAEVVFDCRQGRIPLTVLKGLLKILGASEEWIRFDYSPETMDRHVEWYSVLLKRLEWAEQVLAGKNRSFEGVKPEMTLCCRPPEGGWTIPRGDFLAQEELELLTVWLTGYFETALKISLFDGAYTGRFEEYRGIGLVDRIVLDQSGKSLRDTFGLSCDLMLLPGQGKTCWLLSPGKGSVLPERYVKIDAEHPCRVELPVVGEMTIAVE